MHNEHSRRNLVVQAYIKSHALLGGLSDLSQTRLGVGCELVQRNAGQIVFSQGDPPNSFFALCSGSIKIFRSGSDGREAVVKILQGGEVFGEVAIFKGIPYPASAVCLDDTVCIAIDRSGLLQLLDDKDFAIDFIACLMNKLQYLNSRIYTLTILDVEERFYQFLISNYGSREEYQIDMQKKEIAAAIGTVPETFSRMIQRLKTRGTLTWDENKICVDPMILKLYASEFNI